MQRQYHYVINTRTQIRARSVPIHRGGVVSHGTRIVRRTLLTLLALLLIAAVFAGAGAATELLVGNGQPYANITAALQAASPGDTIKLMNDIIESVTWNKGTSTSAVILDLNGKILTGEGSSSDPKSVIYITSTGNMTLIDSSYDEFYYKTPETLGGAWTRYSGTPTDYIELNDVRSPGELINTVVKMKGGIITGGTGHKNDKGETRGGGVYIDTLCTFNMNGGSITGCSAGISGGGVYVYNGTFNMNGGNIAGCNYDKCDGGGLFAYNSKGTLDKSSIIGCSSENGGGVSISGGSILTMNYVTISGCNAEYNGGGVRIYGSSKLTMTKVIISNCCSRKDNGGAVNILNGTLTINSSTINDCSADNAGGAVFTENNGTDIGKFFMFDSVIKDCKASNPGSEKWKEGGGGVWNKGEFTMKGASSITGCDAQYGGGVGVGSKGTFTIHGAANVTGNTNKTEANNVYLPTGTVVTLGSTLSKDAALGVTMQTPDDNVFTSGWTTYMSPADPKDYFTSDNPAFAVRLKEGEAYLAATKTVTFYSQGGTSVEEQHVVPGEKVIQPDDPTKDGYTFDGWYKEDTCTNAWDFNKPMPDNDLDLYAKWLEEIAVPTAETGLVYNGTEQTGVAAGIGYTLSGDYKAANAGNYTAKATPDDGYCWAGGTGSRETKDIHWSIKAKVVTITGVAIAEKTYDKTTAAAITNYGTIDGVIDGDKEFVSVDTAKATAAFDSCEAGTGNRTVKFSGFALTGDKAENYHLTGQPADLTGQTIKQKELKLQWTGTTFTYNGTEQKPTVSATNLCEGDECTIEVDGGQTNAGTGYPATAVNPGNNNYILPDTPTTTFAITPCEITSDSVTWSTPTHQTYDGKDYTSEITAAADPLNKGAIDLTVTVQKNDSTETEYRNAGTYTATVTKKTYGNGNYEVKSEITEEYIMNKADPKVTAPTAKSPLEYNKTAQELINKGSTDGGTLKYKLGTGDYTEDAPTGTDAGTYTVSYKVFGNENYNDTEEKTLDAITIAQKPVAITGTTVKDKVYDGTKTAEIDNKGTATGFIDGDDVGFTATGAFADKKVGTGKGVTITYALSGTAASNYSLSPDTATITANITEKGVTITGLGAKDKTYDGNTTATPTGTPEITGKIEGDAVTVKEGTAAFEDKNAADGKKVIFTGYELEGEDAANYALSQPNDATANIAKKYVNITGLGAEDKTYDGNTTATATGTPTIPELITGDTVTVKAGSATFEDKNVGVDKTVTFDNYSLEGTDAANYDMSGQPASVKAKITAKEVTVSGITAENKVYDGTKDAHVNCTSAKIDGTVGIETLTVSTTGTFEDASAGAGKTVTLATLHLAGGTGTDANNYTIASDSQTTATADITPRSISDSTVTVTAIPDQEYTGDPITPEPKVKFNDTTLTKGTDYTVIYKDNTEPGTATVTITGIQNFTDSRDEIFTIKKSITTNSSSGGRPADIFVKATVDKGVIGDYGRDATKDVSNWPTADKSNSYKFTVSTVGAGGANGTLQTQVAGTQAGLFGYGDHDFKVYQVDANGAMTPLTTVYSGERNGNWQYLAYYTPSGGVDTFVFKAESGAAEDKAVAAASAAPTAAAPTVQQTAAPAVAEQTAAPTAVATKVATAAATETATKGAKSPAPLAGLVLGALAALLVLRRK
ncbi:MAG TPA: YDG domain-containing protein [Methanocorpusculum sp.]|nr:YDG domain-containing protein [Methanocorpusculum sp.]